MTLPTPRAVIFDWDNTLVNTWPIIHKALNETFTLMGKPLWTMEDTVNKVSKSMRDSFPEVFGENWQEAAEIYQAEYRKLHLINLESLPRSLEVLELVKQKGLFCTVVSNKKGNNLRLEIEHLGWTALFDAIVGANDAAHDKPHADPVNMAFEKTPIKPGKDVWFVGDSHIDLECAMATGCTAILYGEIAKEHHSYTDTHFYGFPYDAHVHNHGQTIILLENI